MDKGHSPLQEYPYIRHQHKVWSPHKTHLLAANNKLRDSHCPLSFDNSLEQLTELRKALFL